ncbi:cell division protein ZapD [Solimonas flava]|uniref:cell division protein ZapD n=1 Tax=Solimonas flava TaxID=415849 RepID=UPI001FDFFA61|nr:cell division protein ZapD [Solimonas flava]
MSEGAVADLVFEQPLSERVRTFLRLELLFAQYRHHRRDRSTCGTRSALDSLLDLLVVISRSDLKNDILKELTDQYHHLTRLAARPSVDQERLKGVLADITEALNELQQLATQFANSLLRGSDFLTSILNRSTIPGGTCGFDLPHYHWWLSQPRERTDRDLDAWFADLAPFERAVTLYLKLLRASVPADPVVAQNGIYLHTPTGPCLLVRVIVPAGAGVYPEISAGRHRFTVRFMGMREIDSRAQQAHADIGFQLQCCNL